MPLHYYTYYSKEKIKIANRSFAAGGEGQLHRIASPRKYKNYIAKIYHPNKDLATIIPKLKYLIEAEGTVLSDSIAFPIDLLLDKEHQYIGFIMPLFKGEKLEQLCQPNLIQKLGWNWKRYDLQSSRGLHYRLQLGFYIAALLAKVHQSQQFTVVDFKPENLLVTPNLEVALVDADSMQIQAEDGTILFKAPVVTIEYAPPEFHQGMLIGSYSFDKNWDNFALAVILYRLFLEVHPYAASSKPPYDSIVNLHGKVEHGLFVHHPSKQEAFKAVPVLHRRFYELPESVQELFIRCFVDGHEDASKRPSALEWALTLMDSFRRYHNEQALFEALLPKVQPNLEPAPMIVLERNTVIESNWEKRYETLSSWAEKMLDKPVLKLQLKAEKEEEPSNVGCIIVVFLLGLMLVVFNGQNWLGKGSNFMWVIIIWGVLLAWRLILELKSDERSHMSLIKEEKQQRIKIESRIKGFNQQKNALVKKIQASDGNTDVILDKMQQLKRVFRNQQIVYNKELSQALENSQQQWEQKQKEYQQGIKDCFSTKDLGVIEQRLKRLSEEQQDAAIGIEKAYDKAIKTILKSCQQDRAYYLFQKQALEQELQQKKQLLEGLEQSKEEYVQEQIKIEIKYKELIRKE